MTSKKKYKLIYAENSTDLSKTVTEYLNDGWKLYGSPQIKIIVDETEDYHYEYQAVTKNIPEGEDENEQ